MNKNVGKVDRYLRLIVGLAAIVAGIVFQSWWGLLGVIPLLTAFIRWCPVYSIFKINTCNPFGGKNTCGAESRS